MPSPNTRPSPPRPSKNPTTPGTSTRQVRPPFDGQRMPLPGVSEASIIRRTAHVRERIKPILIPSVDGYEATHPYVRRYWVAALGPGAVADLLRLAAAAQSGRSLRTPTHLPALLSEGLIIRYGDRFGVRSLIPPLPRTLVARLPSPLQGELIAASRRIRGA
jgi:hypothetical protein